MIAVQKALIVAGLALAVAGCKRAPPDYDASQSVPPVETPHRKPGLWKQTISVDGIDRLQTVSICLDRQSDTQIAWWGQQGLRKGCEKNDVRKNPDGSWSFSSSCIVGGTKTVSAGRAVGDFQTGYQITAETTTSGAPLPQLNGTRSTVVDASWEKECPAGMNPGDMVMPNGQRLNVLQMSDGLAN